MKLNPFAYWPFDPNGYLRHFIAGALLLGVLLLLTDRRNLIFAGCLIIAVIKECFDLLIKGKIFSIEDILFTLIPVLIYILFQNSIKHTANAGA